MYFIDTNTCIDFLRNLSESVRSRFLSIPLNEIKIPVVVKAELLLGAYKSTKTETLERMSYTYAKIRKELEVR